MSILTREQILSPRALKRELVSVPEWGGDVYIRAMTATERDRYESQFFHVATQGRNVNVSMNRENIRVTLLAMTIVDEEGTQLFTKTDIAELGKQDGGVIDRLFTVASQLSGLSAKDVEELAGNSNGSRSNESD